MHDLPLNLIKGGTTSTASTEKAGPHFKVKREQFHFLEKVMIKMMHSHTTFKLVVPPIVHS